MIFDSSDKRIAVVGDIHGFWTWVDTEYFSKSNYDSVIFTGDLGNNLPGNTNKIAQWISKVRKPKYIILGNHDTTSIPQLLMEITNASPNMGYLSHTFHLLRYKILLKKLGDTNICQYNLSDAGKGLSILGARPLSMGARFNFPIFLKSVFGISSYQESEKKLHELIRDIDFQKQDLLVLAHNGPSGLGAKAHDIWGCDFKKEEGDFGDKDLGDFIQTIVKQGKKPKVVIAGHMHHSSRKLRVKTRVWKKKEQDILYLNPARVPRIFSDKQGNIWHHHVELTRKNGVWDAEAKYLKNGVEEIFPLPEFLEREKNRIEMKD
ncbi:metallophosphoesterase [Leptospira sp. SA-E8]|uniref:metallophosphoesterase n=1 Tax=Leptospira sp. SA-E8 TaxID=3422259 RepID=UPI003EB84A11